MPALAWDLVAGVEMNEAELLDLGGAAYRLAARIMGSRQGAEDAVQQAYLLAVRQLRSGPPPRELRNWFLKVTANAARGELRSEANRKRREAAMGREQRTGSPGASAELVAALNQAMGALEEKHRLPVALCCEEGLSHADAAEILDIPKRTLTRRVSEGLEELRKALAGAGYPAAPAMVIGALAHTAPAVPASLAAAIGKVLAGEAVTNGSRAATISVAAKGGIAMKVVLGVVLAGALAGGAALFLGQPTAHRLPPTNLASPPAAQPEPLKGPPQSTHYALAAYWDYLDGPRLGAMAMCHRGGPCDDQNNLYFLTAFGLSALRCVRANGMVETITGDDRPLNDTGLNEGPAGFIPKLSAPGGFGSVACWMSVHGAPYEGEEKGSLYVGANRGPAFRVFRNKAQSGRWWFKRLSFGELKGPLTVLTESDGSLAVFCDGSYYRYDDKKGTITPLLALADYQGQLPADSRGIRPVPDSIARAEDGTFYLSSWGSRTGIYRLSPDKSKCERIIAPHGNAGGPRSPVFDGPAMTTADFFDGPSFCGYRPPHTIFVSAVDDGFLRRWRDGRISTWSEKDGEWHETAKRPNVAWFYGWCMGPRGSNYAYNTYSGQCRAGDDRIFKIGPIDFDKPTTGPLVEGK